MTVLANLLAIDTSTLTATVAVAAGGRVVAARDALVTTHSERLLPLVDELLAEAKLAVGDLHAVACGAGPGSFTGLRIGLATAKGIGYAVGCPLYLVSSLELVAAAVEDRARAAGALILSVLDARKREVYAGLYDPAGGVLTLVGEERVLAPDGLAAIAAGAGGRPVLVIGDANAVYPVECAAAGQVVSDLRATPDASQLARLVLDGRARTEPLFSATPSYVRKSEAELKLEPLGGPVRGGH